MELKKNKTNLTGKSTWTFWNRINIQSFRRRLLLEEYVESCPIIHQEMYAMCKKQKFLDGYYKLLVIKEYLTKFVRV